jgi:hypothetical protein
VTGAIVVETGSRSLDPEAEKGRSHGPEAEKENSGSDLFLFKIKTQAQD